MRRAMMTNRPFGGAPFSVGDAAIDRPSLGGGALYLIINKNNPAPRAGTITSVDIYVATAGDFYVVTGYFTGDTFTVSAKSSKITAPLGATTLTTSLTIPSGGYIGFHSPTTTGGSIDATSSTGGGAYVNPGGSVVVGNSYATTSISATYSIQGTGS